MRRSLRTALLPAVLTVLAVVAQYVPAVFLRGGTVPSWLPTGGSPAVTVPIYRELVVTIGTLAVLAGAFALGYREARHHDVSRTYLRYAAVVCSAGAAVLFLIFGALFVTSGSDTSGSVTVALTVATLLVSIPGVLTVSALAGVAFATTPMDDAGQSLGTRTLVALGLGAALVTGVARGFESATDVLLATHDAPGIPESLPQFGTIGTTVLTYIQVGRLAADLLLIGGGLALGYLAVRRAALVSPSRRFVGSVGLGALSGLSAVLVPATLVVATAEPGRGLSYLVGSIPGAVASSALVATLAAIAGLGVARFESANARTGERGDTDFPDAEAVTETPVSEGSIRDH